MLLAKVSGYQPLYFITAVSSCNEYKLFHQRFFTHNAHLVGVNKGALLCL
jgi:hypothetical protein